MKYLYVFFLGGLMLGLTSCSKQKSPIMFGYEQALVRADSLVRNGVVDSAGVVRLMGDLHAEYDRMKELADGKRVRLTPANEQKRFLWSLFVGLMVGLNVWFGIRDLKFRSDRKYRRFLIELSENEQRLRNNELERNELQECLEEMSLEDDEREEIRQTLTNLMVYGKHLSDENEALRASLKDYEERPLPREAELLKERDSRIEVLDSQVRVLSSALVDGDELVERLRRRPKFLSEKDWNHLIALVDRVYDGFTVRLTGLFPQLTPADLQLCLLMRLRFTNAQIASLTAVSPASVSQQKFRLKKRFMQADGTLFKDGETLDAMVCRC